MANEDSIAPKTSFPFGRENQTSVEELFVFFKNCLSAGKWELARACLKELVDQKDLVGVDVQNLLKNCIDYPATYCKGSSTIRSPHHLSWLCLQECAALFKPSVELDIKREDAELRLLLFEAESLSDGVVKELYRYYKSTDVVKDSLSKRSLDSLSRLLTKDPFLAHSIVQTVCRANNGDSKEIMQLLFIQSLELAVNQLKTQVFADSFVTTVTDVESVTALNVSSQWVLQLLSMLDPSCDMANIQKTLAVVFKEIIFLTRVEINGHPVLERSAIYSALLGRTTTFLIDEFCQVEYILDQNSLQTGAVLDEFEEKTLVAAICSDRLLAWHKMYLLCQKYRKHFLECLVETAVSLIKMKDFERLEQLVSPVEFSPLKPLVLLLGWNHCYSCANARRLLDILWNKTVKKKDKLLEQACQRLAYQVDLVQWCLDKARPLLLASGAPVTLHQRASAMFHGLETHSVLYVLHQSTQLSALESSEVYEILNKCPVMSETENEARKVHFEDKSPSELHQKSSSLLDVEKERDIAIYRSYCILNHFMAALAFCVDLSNPELQLESQLSRRSSSNECSGGDTYQEIKSVGCKTANAQVLQNMSKDDFQEKYNSRVVENIQRGREELRKMFPLTYRVEILENIFSLLFVTHENLQEMTVANEDSGEEGPADETQSLSFCPSEDKGHSSDGGDNSELQMTGANPQDSKELCRENFTISKTVLNDIPSDTKRHVSESGASFKSYSSWSSLYQLGFVVNDSVMRDILFTLKECIDDVNAAKFRLQGQDVSVDPALVKHADNEPLLSAVQEQELSAHVKSSVNNCTLQQRITRLKQYVSEASWRFQLVSRDHIPRQYGIVTNEVISREDDQFSDDDLDVLILDDDSDSPCSSQVSSRRTSPLSLTSVRDKINDSPLSGKDSEALTDSGSGPSKRKKKRRSRSATRHRRSTSISARNTNSIVSRMLASHESLLSMCLKRRNMTQASQVVKMFHMKGVPEAAEVSFSEAFSAALNKFQTVDTNYKSSSVTKIAHNKSSLGSIASLAAVGMATMGVMSIVEGVLSGCLLPGFSDDLINKVSVLPAFADHIHPKNVPAMVTFDLVCVGCQVWDGCRDLLEQVKKKLASAALQPKEQTSKKLSKGEDSVKGLPTVVDRLTALIGQGNVTESANQADPEVFDRWFKKSISQILLDSTHSLHPVSHRTYVNSVLELGKALKNAICERDKFTESTKRSSALNKSPKKDQPSVTITMKYLMHSVVKNTPAGGLLIDHYRSCKSLESGNVNFLASLYEHVKGLAVMKAECEGRVRGELLGEYFYILSEGPTLILGRLIFMQNISPLRLESMANKLNVNLTHIIVKSCCPTLPSNCLPTHIPHPDKGVLHHGKLVLNEPSRVVTSYRQPEFVARELLTRMLQLMKANASQDSHTGVFSLSTAKVTIQTQEYAEIVDSIQELAVVDLSLLATKEDLICFYSNSLNLMYIHVLLHQTEVLVNKEMESAKRPLNTPLDDSYSASIFDLPDSKLDSVIIQSKMAYKIGQLGVVSLFELHYLITRAGLPSPTCAYNLFADRTHALTSYDPWYQYLPDCEPRLLFAISQGCLSSPPVQVLMPELLETQLNAARVDYLNHNIDVNLEERTVTFPELLLWHENDFICDSDDIEVTEVEHSNLVSLALEHTSDKTHDMLSRLVTLKGIDKSNSDSVYHVKFEAFCDDFVFSFSHLPSVSSLPPSGLRRMSSLSLNLDSHSLTSSVSLTRQDSQLEKANFQLTPEALDYLKTNSNLIATLVSLICSGGLDLIGFGHNSNHFSDTIEDAKSNTLDEHVQMDLSNLRSQHYQKLVEEFPALYEHIVATVGPLIKSSSTKSNTAELPRTKTQDKSIEKLERNLMKTGILADEDDFPESRKEESFKDFENEETESDPVAMMFTTPINPALRPCTLSIHRRRLFQAVISTTLNRLLLQKNWTAILDIIGTIPKPMLQNDLDLILLRDFILCCVVREIDLEFVDIPNSASNKDETLSESVAGSEEASEKWKYFSQMFDADMQARSILGTLELWDVDVCIRLLDMCLCRVDLSPGLRTSVQECVDVLQVYQRITDCAKNLQSKSSMRMKHDKGAESFWKLEHDRLERLTSWQCVKDDSGSNPENVLDLLMESNAYDVARKWSDLHNLHIELKQKVEEESMLYLLSLEPADTNKAYRVLERIMATDIDLCFQVCHNLLSKLTYQHASILFVAQFVLSELSEELGDAKREELHLKCMGAKALLCIPSAARTDYEHLISSPQLLLEQLIMNMKIEWAGKAFGQIQQHYSHLLDKNIGCTVANFDALLIGYASKAVEFPVEEVEASASPKERVNSSRQSNLTSPFNDKTVTPVGSLKRTKSSSVSRSPQFPQGSLPGKGEQLTPVFYVDGKFAMPAEPPTKDQWIPDSAVDGCMICSETFSMFNRRHHCRRCGRVVCSACSQHSSVIRGASAKTCNDCYKQIFQERSNVSEQEILNQRLKERLSGSKMTSSPRNGTSPISSSPYRRRTSSRLPILTTETQWKLSLDETYNAALKEEFYFEYSPSISLCLSLLELHSNQAECGSHMLILCDDLSKQLGTSSRQMDVDYNLVISMMKYLLFNAKVKFLKSGFAQGLEQCDRYQSRVDILKLLLSANCKIVPSIEELSKLDTVRRLRDKLIEDERLSVAMEISTKSGLDPSGVWAAWGFACLKSGDYTGAREKFARCLKAPVDRNVSQSVSKLLSDIVSCLEAMPLAGTRSVQTLLAPLKSINSLLAELPTVNLEETNLDLPQLKECVHYLKTYGNYLAMVNFYRRHGYWMKAAQYILDKKCCPDIFIEGLLIPSLQTSELGTLQDNILMIDTKLERWIPYLTAACRYLNKTRHMHVLYEFQLFMKDYLRAAMTCITHFYLSGADTYEHLYNRINYLSLAKKHLDTYLEFHKHPPSRQPDWSTGPESQLRLIQSTNEVCRHISTVNLQTDVTRFLHMYQANLLAAVNYHGDIVSSPGGAEGGGPNRSSQLCTLFGNNKMKAETASLIMLSGNNINDGFGLAFRVIQEFRLNSSLVYTQTARQLSRQRKYNYIKQLLGCIRDSGLSDHQTCDEVIGACVRVIADDPKESKEADSLIKMIKSDSNKINAYLLIGKLKSAYLVAVQLGSVEDVQRIASAASRAGQTSVKNICDKWLQQKASKS